METVIIDEQPSKSVDLTPKAKQTREHIVETALALFAEKGYQETTMRDIAGAAGISLGLTYRYFARKEELILELYRRCALEFEVEVQALPRAPLAKRFGSAIRMDLARLAPHRESLGALFGAGLEPASDVAVLGDSVTPIRELVWKAFLTVATGASDAPKERQAQQLATLFYAAHLSFVLFWLQDKTPGQRATYELVDFAQDMLGLLRPVLGLPVVTKSLTRLAGIMGPMFGPAAQVEEGGSHNE